MKTPKKSTNKKMWKNQCSHYTHHTWPTSWPSRKVWLKVNY